MIALLCLYVANGNAQEVSPQVHGILRGKYEYEPDLDASRFEVRNARLAVDGSMSMLSSYKLEVDLCDESQIKMKDAWVRLAFPLGGVGGGCRATIGQQRMPFSIDAHRNPSAQYFANRSFIAKQVGDMRDVGFQLGYDFLTAEGRKMLSVDAGVFNGSNLDKHSDGKKGWISPAPSQGGEKRLVQSDAERHRLTAGLTFHVGSLPTGEGGGRGRFPTDLRLNYEKYWYPNNGIAKESEQDKLVAELIIRF